MTHQVLWISFAVFVCMVPFSSAKEAQLKLEDIEKETLNNEKPLLPQLANQAFYGQSSYQNSPLPPQQQQQQQQQQYFPNGAQLPQFPPPPTGAPQDSTGPHQFAPDARMFPPPPPLQLQFPSRLPQQQIAPAPPAHDLLQLFSNARLAEPSGHEQQFQYHFPSEDNIFQDPYLHQYFAQSAPQQYTFLHQPQATNQIPVVDNKPQNPPQNLGGIQYVQFVDSNTERLRNPETQTQFLNHQHKSNHNLAGLIQRTAYTNTLPVNYRGPAPQSYRVQGAPLPLVPQNLYVIPPSGPPPPPSPILNFQPKQLPNRPNNQVLGQQRFLIPGIIYAQNQPQPMYQPGPYQFTPQPQPQYRLKQQGPQFQLPQPQPPPQIQYQPQRPAYNEQQQTQQSIANVVYEKREPKSLLDSYVPSVLQIQYYKELQQQQQLQRNDNALRSEGKPSESIVGKEEIVKSSAPTKSAFEYQFE